MMMIENALINIMIMNVTNPQIMVPILYSFSTNFNNIINQQFSALYSIKNPYPLSLNANKNNNTFNQKAILNISIQDNIS